MASGSLTITASDAGQRLDRFLKNRFPMIPYGAIQKWLRKGDVRINGKRAKPDARLEENDELRLPPQAMAAPPKKNEGVYTVTHADRDMVKKALVFEDEAILVLNKPAGLGAQAGDGQTRSLDRILAGIYGADNAPKLVHRLDRETTGVMVLAKTRAAAAALGEQFKGRDVSKEYLVLAVGKLAGQTSGVIDVNLAKKGPMAVAGGEGDVAQTRWKVLASGGEEENLHVILAEPLTGRMNQIRAHLAHIGLPLVGDGKYGGPQARELARRLLTPNVLYLHAWKLALSHPVTGKPCRWEAEAPPHFRALTDRFGSDTLPF
ncbi:MAG TPA: RluA family pseudouridine synthase [Alphaproteobacteria bacterium]|nr:RluA family pseudouridine synthase [Alphaproteobacteria bacterium]